MATKFVKGQNVKLKSVVPSGPVKALRMTEDGEFFYFLEWQDKNGQLQSRWFAEADLEQVDVQ